MSNLVANHVHQHDDPRVHAVGIIETGVDLFCGAGGATRGYVLADHTMTGVETNAKLEDDYLRSGGRRVRVHGRAGLPGPSRR